MLRETEQGKNAQGLFVYKYLPTTLMRILLSSDGNFQTMVAIMGLNKDI